MNISGSRRYPCGHGVAKPVEAAGTYPKKCRRCGGRWLLIVEPSPHLTLRLKAETLHARWANTEADAA